MVTAQASLEAIGPASNAEISPHTAWLQIQVKGVSNDATKVAGMITVSAPAFDSIPFVWTASGGFSLINELAGTDQSTVAGLSGDGNVIIGNSTINTQTNTNYPWLHQNGVTAPLPVPSSTQNPFARCLSNSGSIIAGSTDINLAANTFANRPCYWSLTSPSNYSTTNLPANFPSYTEFQSLGWTSAISGNGRYLFGDYAVSSSPARYYYYRFDRSTGSIVNVSTQNGISFGKISDDGDSALLWRYSGHAYIWRHNQLLEELPFRTSSSQFGGYIYWAYSMSSGANRIVGQEAYSSFGSWSNYTAVYWNEQRELNPISELAEFVGIDTTGWTFTKALGISDDGLTIIGEGNYNGVQTGFRLTLPGGALPANKVQALLFGAGGYFPPTASNDVIAPTADADGDGMANIVEIAIAPAGGPTPGSSHPGDAESKPQIDVNVLPGAALLLTSSTPNKSRTANEAAATTHHVTMTVTRQKASSFPGLNVTMEVTASLSDAQSWSNTGVTETSISIDDTWEQVTFYGPETTGKQFARIKVSYDGD